MQSLLLDVDRCRRRKRRRNMSRAEPTDVDAGDPPIGEVRVWETLGQVFTEYNLDDWGVTAFTRIRIAIVA